MQIKSYISTIKKHGRMDQSDTIANCGRRRQRYELIHVWKIYKGLVPNCVEMEFQTGRLGVQAKTQKYPYWAESKRANQLYNSFGFRAPRLWNKLPREVTLSETLPGFKANLGAFMNEFYDRPPVRGYMTVPNEFREAERKSVVLFDKGGPTRWEFLHSSQVVMTRKRRKFVTDSDASEDEQPGRSKNSSDSLSESSEEGEEWTLKGETQKGPPKKALKRDDKKSQESGGTESEEGELSESDNASLSDDSDGFDDGLDENCMGDAEDRKKLASMTEAERERVLFDRLEKRESMKTRQEIQRKLKLQKKKEEAAKQEAERKKQDHDSKPMRSQRARKQADDKGKGKAIDELRAKREAHKAKIRNYESSPDRVLLKTKDVYSDDEEDDEKSLSSSSSDAESDGEKGTGRAPSPEIIRYITTKEQLSKIRLSRFKLERWVHFPFFKNICCGCYIRIGIGDKMGKKIYRVAEIFDVVDTPKVYTLGKAKTNKGLKVRHGLQESMYRLEFVSNQDFTESEFLKWKTTMDANNLKLPTTKFVDKKMKSIKETMEHEFTEQEIDQIVKEKQKFRKNPLNFATRKTDLLSQKQMAEAIGDFAEVEKLKADIDDLEEDANRLSKDRNRDLKAISYINDKNRARTTDRIEEVLREEYNSIKCAAPNPFMRRKTNNVVVTPKFQAEEDASKFKEVLSKLAQEQLQDKEEVEEKKDTAAPSLAKEKSIDPFDLHNGCDIDIDIGMSDSTTPAKPAESPPPNSSSRSSRRGLNLSEFACFQPHVRQLPWVSKVSSRSPR
eukprot:sb/3462248/